MSKKDKVITWIAVFLLFVSLLASFAVFPPQSCWDKYQTEKEAILNCEGVDQ